jgi:hypothetical protein
MALARPIALKLDDPGLPVALVCSDLVLSCFDPGLSCCMVQACSANHDIMPTDRPALTMTWRNESSLFRGPKLSWSAALAGLWSWPDRWLSCSLPVTLAYSADHAPGLLR